MENNTKKNILLKVQDLNMLFKVRGNYLKVLNNINFEVNQGDFFGIIGESGSGKSTTGKAIIKLYQPSGGSIIFENHLISQKKIPKERKKWIKKNIQMIFQDPMSSMNPIKNILNIVSEPLIVNRIIQTEAFSFIKKIKKVKVFFHYRFNEQNFNYLQLFYEKYFSAKLNSYEEIISKLESTNIENITKISSCVELISSYLDNLISELRKINQDCYTLNKNQEDLIESTIKKYDNHDLEEVDLLLDDVNKKIVNKKIEYKYFPGYFEYKNNLEDNISSMNELKKDFKINHINENWAFIEGALSKFNSDYKTSNQNKHKSNNKINNLYNSIINLATKEKYFLAKKIFKKCKYLNEEYIEKLIIDIENYINNKYTSIITHAEKLENEYLSSSLEEKYKVLKNFKELKAECFNKINEDQKIKEEHFQKYLDISNDILDKYSISLKDLKCKIDQLKKEINDKTKSNSIEIKSLSKKDLDDFKLKKKEIINLRNNFINDFKKDLESKSSEKEQIVNKNKELIFKSKSLWKLITKKITNIFFKIYFKEMKLEKNFFKKIKIMLNNFLIFKSLYAKKNHFKSINFEYKNCVKQFKRNTKLYNAYKFFTYLYYFSFKNYLIRNKVYKALSSVGLKYEHAFRYPHEFSGGQRQRIVIARALITNPKLIIADEPISALDVSIQSQVVNIMKNLSKENGVTFLFIAHDLSMVNYACNRMIIMHNGNIVEKGDVNQIFKNPIHPYTISLMKAVPELSRIHVDLSSFDDNLNYENNYNIKNQPKFYKIQNEDHDVLCTNDQFLDWTKNKTK